MSPWATLQIRRERQSPVGTAVGEESDIWLSTISSLILQFVRRTRGKVNEEALKKKQLVASLMKPVSNYLNRVQDLTVEKNSASAQKKNTLSLHYV